MKKDMQKMMDDEEAEAEDMKGKPPPRKPGESAAQYAKRVAMASFDKEQAEETAEREVKARKK